MVQLAQPASMVSTIPRAAVSATGIIDSVSRSGRGLAVGSILRGSWFVLARRRCVSLHESVPVGGHGDHRGDVAADGVPEFLVLGALLALCSGAGVEGGAVGAGRGVSGGGDDPGSLAYVFVLGESAAPVTARLECRCAPSGTARSPGTG